MRLLQFLSDRGISRFLASHPKRRRLERIARSGLSIEASMIAGRAWSNGLESILSCCSDKRHAGPDVARLPARKPPHARRCALRNPHYGRTDTLLHPLDRADPLGIDGDESTFGDTVRHHRRRATSSRAQLAAGAD